MNGMHPNDLGHRFATKVEIDANGCWLWTASLNEKGYAQFKAEGRTQRAHKYTWQWVNGPVPLGLELDHTCRVRRCVNPDHLGPVTHRENVIRGDLVATTRRRKAAQTHCKHGHEFSSENTLQRRNHLGTLVRRCRMCAQLADQNRNRDWAAEWRRRKARR